LLSVLPHDRRRRLHPNAATAVIVDVGALRGDATVKILGSRAGWLDYVLPLAMAI
jgi:hypothetical protein